MNCFEATYRPVCGGFHAIVRLPRDGASRPVLGKGGKPTIYPDALAAQKAATAVLLGYINGNLRRDGERLSPARSEAEALFVGRKNRRSAHA